MKIRNINGTEHGAPASKGLEAGGVVASDKELLFRRTMDQKTGEQRAQYLDGMMEKIGEQGRLVAQRADIKEFGRYRRLIREFMQEIVSGGYEYSKESAFEARGRHRFLSTVKTVDEKLDGMAKKILEGQAETLELLESVEDIKGLLLDIRG